MVVCLATAVFGPMLVRTDPLRTDPAAIFVPPSSGHVFGTDNLGRDVFAGVVWGTRTAMLVGFLSMLGSSIVGVIVGAAAGYFRGRVDGLLVRVTEFFIVIPRLFLALVLVAFFGANIWVIILTLGVVGWPQVARLVRAEFLILRGQEFVEAVIALGGSDVRVILKHMLPNTASTLIVNASLQISTAILLEAGLAFFGLGDPNRADWGAMLNTAQLYFRQAFWIPLFPGLALTITGLGLNLFGDGLAELLTPRLRGGVV